MIVLMIQNIASHGLLLFKLIFHFVRLQNKFEKIWNQKKNIKNPVSFAFFFNFRFDPKNKNNFSLIFSV